MSKPTIYELEKILEESPGKVALAPDGSVHVGPSYEELEAELARLREALDMPDGYVLLPVKPTYELVVAMAVKKWPDIWEKGKKLQMELGCGVVPPNAECEEAAGTYMQLIEALKSNDS